jgi:hypothetical protein
MLTSFQNWRAGLHGRGWRPAGRLGQAESRPLIEHIVGRLSARAESTLKTVGGLGIGIAPVALASEANMEPVFWTVFSVGALTWLVSDENRLALGIVGGSTGTYLLRKLNVF